MSTNAAVPARAATPLQRGVVGTLGVLLLLLLCYFHFSHNVKPGVVTPEGMDLAQAARRVAGGEGLSTNVVRPLVLRYVKAYPDGSLPDVAHSPLYLVLVGDAIRLTGREAAWGGDRMAAFLSLCFFLTSLAACYLLARRLFGQSGALLSCLLYTFGANALTRAIDPRPVTLATTLFTLLLLALIALDVTGTAKRADLPKAAWAGALYGLLFLTLYSSLILLLPVLVYLVLVTKRDYRAVGAFLLTALVVASPLLIRNQHVAGNPFFNARLLELVMQTAAYPGYTLYRSLGMPQTLPEYLANGGIGEILLKMGNNILGYYSQIPYSFGILLLPLFLVASLTRFTNPQVNRIRFLVYVLLGLHIAGLSLFLPFAEGLPLLLMYLPFAAVIGTTFFLNFIRARNMPPFSARAAITTWVVIACVPGLAQLLAGGKGKENAPYNIYADVSNSPAFARGGSQDGILMSEAPWEVAYRINVPAVWLPNNSSEFRATEEHVGKTIAGILMTPALELYADDPESAPWRATYLRITSLLVTASTLDRNAQRSLLQKARLTYPQEISDILKNFAPRPIPEASGAQYSIFWSRRERQGKEEKQSR